MNPIHIQTQASKATNVEPGVAFPSYRSPSSIHPAPAKHAGLSVMELTIGSVIVISIAIFIGVQLIAVFGTTTNTQALVQVQTLVNSSRVYRTQPARGGLYTDLTVEVLQERGFSIGGVQLGPTDGTADETNVYGLAVALVGTTAGGADATLTYETPNEESCLFLVDVFTDGTDFFGGAKTGTECDAANELTVVIE